MYLADDTDYTPLFDVLIEAFDQSANGKGRERHANDLPFDRQPILEISRMVGPGFPLGQAMKKSSEAFGMLERNEYDRAVHELLGAIVYTAGAIIRIREIKNSVD